MLEREAGVLHAKSHSGRSSACLDEALSLTLLSSSPLNYDMCAANYEYSFSWILHLDGTIGFEAGLTGIVSTHALFPGEQAMRAVIAACQLVHMPCGSPAGPLNTTCAHCQSPSSHPAAMQRSTPRAGSRSGAPWSAPG